MKIKIISTHQEFLSISKIWKKIYLANDTNSFFQSYEWNYNWFLNNLHDQRLFIITFFEVNKREDIKAIFPCYIDSNGTLRLISDVHSDNCALLFNDCSIYDKINIFKLFKGLVEKEEGIRSINFLNLSGNESTPFLMNLFPNNSICEMLTLCSYLHIDKDGIFPDSVSYYRASHRKQIIKNLKKFISFKSSVICQGNNIFPFSQIINLRNTMINEGRRKIHFLTDEMVNTIKELYIKDLIIFHIVENNNHVVSINIILRNKDGFQFWIDLYNDIPQLNIYSINSFINNVSERGIKIGFGRGYYEFKVTNYLPSPKSLHIFYYSKSSALYYMYLLNGLLKNIFNINK